MEWSSTVPATEANTGQSYLPARTSSRSLISALFLAPLVGRLAGKATPPHSYSRQLMEEKRGHRFPFRSHESSIVAVSFASTSQRTWVRSELDFLHVRIASTQAAQVESNQRWHCSDIRANN